MHSTFAPLKTLCNKHTGDLPLVCPVCGVVAGVVCIATVGPSNSNHSGNWYTGLMLVYEQKYLKLLYLLQLHKTYQHITANGNALQRYYRNISTTFAHVSNIVRWVLNNLQEMFWCTYGSVVGSIDYTYVTRITIKDI